VAEHDVFRKVDRTSRADCMAPRSPDLTPMDFFPWGQLKDHVYAVVPSTIEYLVARLQTAVATADASALRRILENSLRCTTVWVEMDCSPSEHKLKLRGAHGIIIL
jgi:hypothetical protein